MKTIEEAVDACLAIQGWKTRDELVWIGQHASRSQTVIDVGCWRGRTTKLMASVMKPYGKVIAVDNLQAKYSGETARNEIASREGKLRILTDFMGNLYEEIHGGQVHGIFLDGDEARRAVAALLGGSKADFAWIDGNHDYEDVAADIRAYRPLMAPGSVFAGHDYEPAFPGVVRAVNDLCPDFERGPGTAWFCRIK